MNKNEALVAKIEISMVNDFRLNFKASVLEIFPNLDKAIGVWIESGNGELFKALLLDCEEEAQKSGWEQ